MSPYGCFQHAVCNGIYSLPYCTPVLLSAQIEPTELAIAADPTTKEFRDLVKSHNAAGFLPESINMLNEFYQPFLQRFGEIMGDPVKFTWRDT